MKRKTSGLLDLPAELKGQIFKFLKPSEIAEDIDATSRSLGAFAEQRCKQYYGGQRQHRLLDGPLKYRQMAQDKENTQKQIDKIRKGEQKNGGCLAASLDPKEWTKRIIDRQGKRTNSDLKTMSQRGVLFLHECSRKNTPVWFEAMATLMMAQGRYAEALDDYQAVLKKTSALPQRTWLVAARFGWPYAADMLPKPSAEILGKGIIIAALVGNVSQIQWLQQKGADLNFAQMQEPYSPALSAASQGHAAVIQYLHEQGVDVSAGRSILTQSGSVSWLRSPMRLAVEHDRLDVVRFLLGLNANIDIAYESDGGCSLLQAALYGSKTSVLTLFIEHTPQFKRGPSTAGHRLVAELFAPRAINQPENRARTVAFLIDKNRLNVQTVNDNGRTLAHLAARVGDTQTLKVLHQAGADIKAQDAAGWTPEDLAVSYCHENAAGWLQSQAPTISSCSVRIKEALAREILQAQRLSRIKQQLIDPQRNYFFGDSLQAKFESAKEQWRKGGFDAKILKIWTLNFSANTLQRWHDRGVNTNLDVTARLFFDLIVETSAENTIALSSAAHVDARIVRALLFKLYPNVDLYFPAKRRVAIAHAVSESISAKKLSMTDLRELRAFYETELGSRIAAGYRDVFSDEQLYLLNCPT